MFVTPGGRILLQHKEAHSGHGNRADGYHHQRPDVGRQPGPTVAASWMRFGALGVIRDVLQLIVG